jgi:hypothetical protein
VVWAEAPLGANTVYVQQPLHTGEQPTRLGDVRPLVKPGLATATATATATGGLGLALMRERATEIGARLTITSAPGAGTTVEVRLT